MKKTNFFLPLLLFVASTFFFSCKKESNSEYSFLLNLNKGDEFRQEVVIDLEAEQSVYGQTVKIPTTIGLQISYAVDSVNEDNYIIRAVYDRIIVNAGLGMISIKFDSDYNDDPLKMGHVLKAMTGMPITMGIDKYGNLISIEGKEEITKAFNTAFEQYVDEKYKKQISELLGEGDEINSMDGIIEQLFFYIPDKKVKAGDTWDTTDNLNKQMGSTGTSTVTLKSVKKDIASLEFKGNILSGNKSINMEAEDVKANVSLVGTQKGTIKINVQTALPSHVEMYQEISTVVKSDDMNITQKITVKTTITEI